MMKNNSNISERILYLVENQFKGNRKKFAEFIGFAPQVINNIVAGRKSKPSFDLLKAIITSIDYIKAEWLISGKGEMLKTKTETISQVSEETSTYGSTNKYLLEYIELLKKENEELKKNKENFTNPAYRNE
jgi:transcriptional regulator with XRE-family HTH domain